MIFRGAWNLEYDQILSTELTMPLLHDILLHLHFLKLLEVNYNVTILSVYDARFWKIVAFSWDTISQDWLVTEENFLVGFVANPCRFRTMVTDFWVFVPKWSYDG